MYVNRNYVGSINCIKSVLKFIKENENQKTNDAHFTTKEYFRCPVIEHNVEKIDIALKWNDQVCIVNMYYIYIHISILGRAIWNKHSI